MRISERRVGGNAKLIFCKNAAGARVFWYPEPPKNQSLTKAVKRRARIALINFFSDAADELQGVILYWDPVIKEMFYARPGGNVQVFTADHLFGNFSDIERGDPLPMRNGTLLTLGNEEKSGKHQFLARIPNSQLPDVMAKFRSIQQANPEANLTVTQQPFG